MNNQKVTMSTLSDFLDDTLDKCGGFGLFQFLVIGSLFLGEFSVAWSILMMTFGGAIPDWSCDTWSNKSSYLITINDTHKSCSPPDNYTGFSCVHKTFDPSLHTVVSEWELVCEEDRITQSITTIQMGGLLIGCILAGQLGDLFGRKPTYFLSLCVLLVSNLIAAFSVSWQMFAILRFFIGSGCGIYLTVHLTFKVEFISGKYRPILVALPIFSVIASAFGGLAYLIHDWMYIHVAIAAVTLPLLFTWWLIPESFRWLVANDKVDQAEYVIKKIATMNRNPVPDTSKLKHIAASTRDDSNRYTYFDILKNPDLRKKSIFLAVGWISCGYSYYAISFGVQQLSGSLYLNIFLLSIIEIPSLLVAWFLNHCIGRKWTTVLFFFLAAVTGTVVGTVQSIETEWKGSLINGFVLVCKLGVGTGWACLMLLTGESFPTVVRNLGYGIQNTVARIGAMVAPQIVYVSQHTSGVMYFLCGGLMFLSALSTMCVPDTKELGLSDVITDNDKLRDDAKTNTTLSGKHNEAFDSGAQSTNL